MRATGQVRRLEAAPGISLVGPWIGLARHLGELPALLDDQVAVRADDDVLHVADLVTLPEHEPRRLGPHERVVAHPDLDSLRAVFKSALAEDLDSCLTRRISEFCDPLVDLTEQDL